MVSDKFMLTGNWHKLITFGGRLAADVNGKGIAIFLLSILPALFVEISFFFREDKFFWNAYFSKVFNDRANNNLWQK